MINFLPTKELAELKNKHGQFLAQPKSAIQKHNHSFRKVFTHHPGMGALNSKAYNACFDCGKMVQIPIDEQLNKEIQDAISVNAGVDEAQKPTLKERDHDVVELSRWGFVALLVLVTLWLTRLVLLALFVGFLGALFLFMDIQTQIERKNIKSYLKMEIRTLLGIYLFIFLFVLVLASVIQYNTDSKVRFYSKDTWELIRPDNEY